MNQFVKVLSEFVCVCEREEIQLLSYWLRAFDWQIIYHLRFIYSPKGS